MLDGFVRTITSLASPPANVCNFVAYSRMTEVIHMGPAPLRLYFPRSSTAFQLPRDPYMLFSTGVFRSEIVAVASFGLNYVPQETDGGV